MVGNCQISLYKFLHAYNICPSWGCVQHLPGQIYCKYNLWFTPEFVYYLIVVLLVSFPLYIPVYMHVPICQNQVSRGGFNAGVGDSNPSTLTSSSKNSGQNKAKHIIH